MTLHYRPHPSRLVDNPNWTPRYRIGPEDRVRWRGREWRSIQDTEVGHVLLDIESRGPSETITHEDLRLQLKDGRIEIDIGHYAPDKARGRLRHEEMIIASLSEKQQSRLFARAAYAQTFLDFEREGRVVRTEASVDAAKVAMTLSILTEKVEESTGPFRKNTRRKFEMNTPPCAKSILRWAFDYEFGGLAALQDDCAASGNRVSRLLPDEEALLAEVVRGYADPLRPSKNRIHENVGTRFAEANAERVRKGLAPLRIPGKDAVRSALDALDPFETDIRRYGLEAALKKHATAGIGLVVELPLERVEMDEWKVDLITFLAQIGFLEKLSPEMRAEIETGRWYLTVALDVATRCFLAMRLSRTMSTDSAVQTLEMITVDKQQWADAVGALSAWFMHGTPVSVATDNGSNYKSRKYRMAVQAIGSEPARPVAGAPQLRAFVERVFGSISTRLMQRLSGRTFSDIIERGDYDPGKHVAHDADPLAFALIRWVVDIYHNTPRPELGGESPIQAWRRLDRARGTPPPPSLRRRRLAFGTVLTRKVTSRGVRVMGVDYSSPELMDWFRHNRKRAVEVRWLPSDIGGVLVRLTKSFAEVPATHADVFSGVEAGLWIAAGRDMRARLKANEEVAADVIRQALQAIEEVDRVARGRAGIVVEDWSDKRIAREEARVFGAFRMAEPSSADDGAPRSDLLSGVVPAGGAASPATDAQPVDATPLKGAGAPSSPARRQKPPSAPKGPFEPTELE